MAGLTIAINRIVVSFDYHPIAFDHLSSDLILLSQGIALSFCFENHILNENSLLSALELIIKSGLFRNKHGVLSDFNRILLHLEKTFDTSLVSFYEFREKLEATIDFQKQSLPKNYRDIMEISQEAYPEARYPRTYSCTL